MKEEEWEDIETPEKAHDERRLEVMRQIREKSFVAYEEMRTYLCDYIADPDNLKKAKQDLKVYIEGESPYKSIETEALFMSAFLVGYHQAFFDLGMIGNEEDGKVH